jgi:hypothetical protein
MLMLSNPAKSDKLTQMVEPLGGVDTMCGPYFAAELAMSIFVREGV